MYTKILSLTAVALLSFGMNPAQAKQSFPEMLEDTKSFSGRVRAAAIAGIGEEVTASMIDKNKIIDLLMGVIKNDPNLRVRREALSVLSHFATKGIKLKELASLAKPIVVLGADKEAPLLIRRDALKLCSQLLEVDNIQYDAVRSVLLQVLQDKKEVVALRSAALKSLATFGGDKNMQIVLQYLRDRNEEIAAAAVLALANAAGDVSLDKRNLILVMGIIKDTKDEDALLAILRAVSRIELSPDVALKAKELVKDFINHENEELMIYAAVIAQKIDYVKALPLIGARLELPFEKPENAIRLVDVLAGFSDRLSTEVDTRVLRKNVKPLNEIYAIYAKLLLSTEDAQLGAALAWVYGDIPFILNRDKACKDLIELLSVDGPVGAAALNSLKMVSGELYGPDKEKWTKWVEKNGKLLKAKKIK